MISRQQQKQKNKMADEFQMPDDVFMQTMAGRAFGTRERFLRMVVDPALRRMMTRTPPELEAAHGLLAIAAEPPMPRRSARIAAAAAAAARVARDLQ